MRLDSEAHSLLLVPVDFSDASRAALDYAVSLAGTLPARVRLLHVWDPFLGLADAAPAPDAVTRAQASASTKLEFWRDRASTSGIDCRTRLEAGPVAKTIVQVASEQGADFIVIGARGADAIPEVSMGSVAERVLRMATCPVLCVGGVSAYPPESIVVGLDLGSGCAVLTGLAHRLGRAAGRVEVRLVHVVDDVARANASLEPGELERYLGALGRAAEQRLAQMTDPSEIRRGSPAAELAAASRAGPSVVVVVGSRASGSHAGAIRHAVLDAGASVLSVPL